MVMKVAVDKEDFDRMDKGLKPRPKPEKEMPEPKPITGVKQIAFSEIPLSELVGFTDERKVILNKEGTRFVGYNVSIQISDKKPITGWMAEGDMIKLRQATRK